MSHQQKKHRIDYGQINLDDDHLVTFDTLCTDEIVLIFEYLSPENIMLARLNKKMRDAAITVVPMDNDIDDAFHVDSVRKYNSMAAMTTALPNLQQIKIGRLNKYWGHIKNKYNDGEDPNYNTIATRHPNQATYDIGILSNFTRLRELTIEGAPLNGRYPALFNFPLLQKLHLSLRDLKCDLEMLEGLPSLEEFTFKFGRMTGNIRSLRVLKDTLSKIDIRHCGNGNVQGNVMDLADFPKLKYLCLVECGAGVTIDFEEISKDAFQTLETLEINNCHRRYVHGNFMNLSDLSHLKVLNLGNTAVTGDIRDIRNDDFPSLESLELPSSVYGGCGFLFQRITDAPDVIAEVFTLIKQRPNLQLKDWYARLSCDSPDWYEALGREDEGLPVPPLTIEFVKAGPRLGWRWRGIYYLDLDLELEHPCEIHWIYLEPSKESVDYEQYIQELAGIEEYLHAYKGYYEPPDLEEYHRIYYEYQSRDCDY